MAMLGIVNSISSINITMTSQETQIQVDRKKKNQHDKLKKIFYANYNISKLAKICYTAKRV